jgi:hypothetical protein
MKAIRTVALTAGLFAMVALAAPAQAYTQGRMLLLRPAVAQ